MKTDIDLGVLFSCSGTYAAVSLACRRGALRAIADVNADVSSRIRFLPIERDPAGQIENYAPLCAEILETSRARHIIGCVTSSSRKEVIPILDRTGAMLWYNLPYEGFESSDRVIYTHACANQHLLPLLNWCFGTYGRNGFLVGSNYIWGWETCRVARSQIEQHGGRVMGERYLPLGDGAVEEQIAAIEAARPDFVLNSLVGASSYRFIEAYVALGQRNPRFAPSVCPVLSCNLTECELPMLGGSGEGLISAGPWFSAPGSGDAGLSSMERACYRSVKTLARLLEASVDCPADAFLAARGAEFGIDPETHHATLDVKVAQVRNGAFEVLATWEAVPPDPYLTRPARHPALRAPMLRLVSQ